jgi:DNA-directed RNA polymerase specialized sigma24 family protein
MCSTSSDELMQCVAMAREGEEARDAFKIIVDRHTIEMRGRIAHWLSKLLPGASKDRCDQLALEAERSAWCQAWGSASTFDRSMGTGQCAFEPWFSRICRNATLKIAKGERVAAERFPHSLDDIADFVPAPESKVPIEVLCDIAAVLSRLSPAERDILARHLDGQGLRTIGRELGQSSRQVAKVVDYIHAYFRNWRR